MSNHLSTTLDHDQFDHTVRRHHAESVERLSPRVRAQLIQRRKAANRGEAVHRGYGLPAGVAAFATLCALAIGLQLRPAAVPGSIAPVESTPAVAATARTHSTMLDEDPEFYAWLASTDAQQVAME